MLPINPSQYGITLGNSILFLSIGYLCKTILQEPPPFSFTKTCKKGILALFSVFLFALISFLTAGDMLTIWIFLSIGSGIIVAMSVQNISRRLGNVMKTVTVHEPSAL